MALTCARGGQNLTLNCDNLPVASLRSTFYYANREDITFTIASDVITGFTMAAGTFLYSWSGPEGKTFINGTYEQRQGTLINGLGHAVTTILPEDTQVALSELGALNNAKVVVFYLKETYEGDPTIRVAGVKHGLVVTEITGDETGADNEGLPGLVLSTPEGVREKLPPQHFLSTDFATTLGLITAALAA